MAYNLELQQDGKAVQPSGMVTVTLVAPAGLKAERCAVFRVEEDGTLTDMKARENNGKLSFSTDHFSLYAVVEQSSKVQYDADDNGVVDLKDAVLTAQFIANQNVTIYNYSVTDPTLKDVVTITRKVLNGKN